MTHHLTIPADHIVLEAPFKKRREAFRWIAQELARTHGIEAERCETALGEREKLGSTAMGRGIALPHAPVPGLREPLIYFVRLADPMDFSAPDDQPVDLMLVALLPEHGGAENMPILSKYARLFRDDTVLAALRSAKTAEAVQKALAVHVDAGPALVEKD